MYHHFVALAGWFIYNWLLFTIAKDRTDRKHLKFNYTQYFNHNWDNWVLTLILAPWVVVYMKDTLFLVNKWSGLNLPMLEVYYLSVGVIVELIYFGMLRLKNKNYKLIPKQDTGEPKP